MMKLSLLQAVVDTLNENHESPLADAVINAWTQDRPSPRYFRASANFIFTCTVQDQPSILRFNHATERTVEAIEAELAFLHHLAAHGVSVALPKRSLSGQLVESVPTPLGVFHAVVFERLTGNHLEFTDLSLDQFTEWGRTLGIVHQAAEGYSGSGRPTVFDHLSAIEKQLPADEYAAWQLLAHLNRQIAVLPVNDSTFGLTHYDFELDNLLWDEQVNIIDFDDCASYWFSADIAFALRDLFDDQADLIDLDDERLLAFVRGYRMARMIDDEELGGLPLFLQIHNLVMFAKLLRATDIEDMAEAPSWMKDLCGKLLQKAATYRASFSTVSK